MQKFLREHTAAESSTLPFLNEAQLAERWQVSRKMLQACRYKNTGVKYYRIGRLVRYALADVESYEACHMVQPMGGSHV